MTSSDVTSICYAIFIGFLSAAATTSVVWGVVLSVLIICLGNAIGFLLGNDD